MLYRGIGKVGCSAGQEGCGTGGMQNRRDSEQEGHRTARMQAGLGTLFFSVQNVPFFSVLQRERYVLFRSFPFFSQDFGDL